MKKKFVKIVFALSCILMAFIVFGCNPEVAVTPTSTEESTTTQRALTSISVSGSPSKTVYLSGESFDSTGLTVTATYDDGYSSEVTGFTISGFDTSTYSINEQNYDVTINYTENGVTKTAEVTGSYYVAASDALTKTVIANGTTTIDGTSFQLVKFGDFPQTIADDEITYSESTVYNGWYLGSDGYFYERCTANPYTCSDSSQTCTDGTVLEDGTTYYFKVEPIEWRVLTSSFDHDNNIDTDSTKLLLAENILTANVPYYKYDSSSNTRTIDETTVYPNNYKYSQIRAYLNGLTYYNDSLVEQTSYDENGFLQKAFTTSAQDLIETTTVDNSAASTTDSTGALDEATNYACDNTSDKIFLLSEQEVTTSTYGFAAYNVYFGDTNGTTESSRIRQTTDYAKANYAYQRNTSGHGGWWWLRSPYYSNSSYYARDVFSNGNGFSQFNVDISEYGVCPALCVE